MPALQIPCPADKACLQKGVAYLPLIPPEDATGELEAVYDQAKRRAGRVYNILKVMSRGPHALRASMDLYLAIMHGPSALSRAQREMLAVVVSAVNQCHY